jgi:hypothetical protein
MSLGKAEASPALGQESVEAERQLESAGTGIPWCPRGAGLRPPSQIPGSRDAPRRAVTISRVRRGREVHYWACVSDIARGAPRVLLTCVILLFVPASTAGASAAGRILDGSSVRNTRGAAVVASPPRVSVSYAVRGLRVTASGVISHGGPTGVARVGRRVEVEEETNAQSGATEWRVLASIPMASRAGRSSFALSFKEGRAVGTLMLRVRVVSGLHVLAESPPKRVRLGPVVVVRSTLRGTSVQAPPREVESVSGSPGATQIVILARGATVPSVGGALVIGVSPHAPNGLLGVVTAVSPSAAGPTTVTTRPATLEEAYSSFDAQINGTLGELASEDSSAAAHAAASIGSFADVSFSCDDPGVQHSITHTINLSELHVSAEIVIPSYSNGFSGPFINFDLGGHPKFGLGVNFGGYVHALRERRGKHQHGLGTMGKLRLLPRPRRPEQ